MEIQQIDILLRLLIAHLLADYVFQTNRIVKGKKMGLRSVYFYFHILLVGLFTYLLLADWANWWAPLFMMLAHALIDLIKVRLKTDGTRIYLADQLLHIISMVVLWILLSSNTVESILLLSTERLFSDKILLLIVAYLTVSLPVGYLIGFMTRRWQVEINTGDSESLRDAGKWIGITERILVITFILINQWPAIGFLLAAKSVFRFGDLRETKDRQKTEYILIGTFISFAFAIGIGILVGMMMVKM